MSIAASAPVAKIADAQRRQDLAETARQLAAARGEKHARRSRSGLAPPDPDPDDAGDEDARDVETRVGGISRDYAAMASYLVNALIENEGEKSSTDTSLRTDGPRTDAPSRETFAAALELMADDAAPDHAERLRASIERVVADLSGASAFEAASLSASLWAAVARAGDDDRRDDAALSNVRKDLRRVMGAYLGASEADAG